MVVGQRAQEAGLGPVGPGVVGSGPRDAAAAKLIIAGFADKLIAEGYFVKNTSIVVVD